MPFKSKLNACFIVGRDLIELVDTLIYFDNRSRELFVVPVGFICNGASIPQALWSMFGSPFDFELRQSAVLHDLLYRNNAITKIASDQMFYDALRETGMSYFKAQSLFIGVKVFGNKAYNKKQESI